MLLQHVGPGSGMNRQRVVPLQATGQLTLTFEVGTVERHQSAMDVVRRAGVPRSHVHGLARHLIGKGAVRRIEGHPVMYEAV